MLLYKDVFTGDELLTDSFDLKDKDGVWYEVQGKMISVSHDVDVDIGANASADGQDEGEGCDAAGSETVVDVVHMNNLTPANGFDGKSLKSYIMNYMKTLSKYLEENKPDIKDATMKGCKPLLTAIMKEWDEYSIYQGESQEDGGMLVFMKYNEDGSGCTFWYLKAGLKEEKV